MGSKPLYLLITFMIINLGLQAQPKLDFVYVDSVTYRYYIDGNWEKLIKLAASAIKENIDYKYLRQRMGYAFFVRGDFSEAARHFRKASEFDSYDAFTQEYLYYSYLNSGREDAAALVASRMDRALRDSLSISLIKPVEGINAEYNFKYAATSLRSNPSYYNVGISSRLGGRLWLYQMISNYYQRITIQLPLRDAYVDDRQFEYYAMANLTLSRNLSLRTAYHHLNTTYSLSSSSSDLGYLGLTSAFSNLLIGIEGSLFYIEKDYVSQYSILASVNGLGRHDFYLGGNLSLLTESNSSRVIYSQKAGVKLSNRMWLEGNVILGNLNNFNDFSAMYVHNSLDPVTFRSGATAFFYPGRHISFWVSFAYERKQYYEDINYDYNQFCYLGGIKWKI